MDYKTLVNKESFKTLLIHHLKSQIKTKYSHSISNKIQESFDKEDSTSTNHVVSSISNDILESESFPQFVNSFLENVNSLLKDKESYVPKQEKPGNSSQCSSASSVNGSSIDFLSPDQFAVVTESLKSGTNAEKLESLGILYRLPTLEHLTHHFLWVEVENGLHEALSSPIIFLRCQSLRLYIKMLTCTEAKVVLESYQSLIKFFLKVFLPELDQTETDKCRCAIEIISILNKFIQNISTHWLRYPQSMIESITTQSLEILSAISESENSFPTWTCIAMCDPEAKWLKSLLHGHISRASLLNALKEKHDILHFVLGMCKKFTMEDNHFGGDCCQKPHLIAEITHAVCFLSHLLGYCDGRAIFDSMTTDSALNSWTDMLCTVMDCTVKLCNSSCFNCCVAACDLFSSKWLYFWCNEELSTNDLLINMFFSKFESEDSNLNVIYLAVRCFSKSYGGISNVICSRESRLSISNFLLKCLNQCLDVSISNDETINPVICVVNLCINLMKIVFQIPSYLFLNYDFIKIISQWLLKVKEFNHLKSLSLTLLKKETVVSEIENNILDISVAFLNKPVRNIICSDVSAYEAYLNILLEKILKDIKIANSVCPVDLSILSRSLSSALGTKFVMNQAFIFRLSSIIWQLKDKANDLEDMFSLKLVLETLLPAVFCDLPLSENTLSSTDPILCLFHQVLMLPGASIECVEQEDYIVLALQIISLLCSSVHSVCMLESEFKLTKLLLERQSQYPLIDNKESIDDKPLINDKRLIDPISILQNHILVKMNAFGGSGEKILPLEMLDNSDDVYNSPFVMELPLPGNFYHCHSCENDVLLADEYEIVDLKNDFITIMQSKSQISPNLIYQFIEKSLGSLHSDINYSLLTDPVALDDFDCTLHKTELVGAELVKRYGIYLKLISDVDSSKLERLLKSTKCLIKNEESKKIDIFACSIYLMCKGNVDTAWLFLQNFTKSSASLFVWTEYQAHVSENFSSDSVPIQSVICELCDIIVKQSLPELYSAMQFRGITPSLIFTYWSQQCYWNYLDFAEISHFVLLNVLFSGQFTLYFFVAVLKHMQNAILDNAHNPELFMMLLKGPIQNFKVGENLNYMMELSDTFQETINMYFPNIVRDQIDS